MKKNMLLITLFITGLLANTGSLFAAAAAPAKLPDAQLLDNARKQALREIGFATSGRDFSHEDEATIVNKLEGANIALKILQALNLGNEDQLRDLVRSIYDIAGWPVDSNLMDNLSHMQPYSKTAKPLQGIFSAKTNQLRNDVLDRMEDIVNQYDPKIAPVG